MDPPHPAAIYTVSDVDNHTELGETVTNAFFYDGQKAVNIFNNPDAWTVLGGDTEQVSISKLYQTVATLYRCVGLRANAVAAMPYTLLQGKKPIATWTGTDFEDDIPEKMQWLNHLNDLLAKVEAASCLVGGAYWGRRKNILGTRDLKYDWFLPSSIYESFNGRPGIGGMKHDPALPLGELVGFWRTIPYYGTIIDIAIEDMVYFWLPDYGVEIGRAINTPGRAVLQNAGVIHSMDVFLHGYFERGLVKAFIGKYSAGGNNTMQVPPSPEEVNRFKEFIRRVLLGAKNFARFEIFRSDFSIETIGEGIKDLRDNALTRDEKDAIATGMGVPLSKLNSTSATDSNRQSDEVQFIQDTVIPEIGWIYAVLNEQIFERMGLRIKAQPDTLAVMQQDENQRAGAWASYVNAGMSAEAATAVLGIDIPDGVELMPPPKPIPPMLQPFTGQPSAPQNEEEETEKTAVAVLELLDKREEKRQFERWLKNRNYTAIRVSEFASEYLNEQEKTEIAIKAAQHHTTYKATSIDKLQDDYGDQLAAFIEGAIENDLDRGNFISGMRDVVFAGLLTIFKESADVPQNENLTPEENDIFNNMLVTELSRVDDYARDLFDGLGKTARFNRVKERLQELVGNLGGRLSVWANAARKVFNAGMIWGRRDIEMTWQFGATEKHCVDCLFYNGQTKSREDWRVLALVGIQPQSPFLECKGYNCDCRLVEA